MMIGCSHDTPSFVALASHSPIRWVASTGWCGIYVGRPACLLCVQTNEEDKVRAVTKAGLEKATSDRNIREAIACLSEGLSGVGPATASAIIAAYR